MISDFVVDSWFIQLFNFTCHLLVTVQMRVNVDLPRGDTSFILWRYKTVINYASAWTYSLESTNGSQNEWTVFLVLLNLNGWPTVF